MAKEKTAETAVVATVEQRTELTAPAEVPAFVIETEAQDMIIPFLKVVQAQSDEVTPGKDKYNENVRPGNIYDATTRTVYNNPEIIICGLKRYYGEWKGDVRGELVGKHKVDSDVVKNAKKIPQTSAKGIPYFDLEHNGNRLEETFGVVCVVKNNGSILPATFTLSKSSFTAVFISSISLCNLTRRFIISLLVEVGLLAIFSTIVGTSSSSYTSP